jgi:ribosomal protein S12 methylthiotransferase accessory factor
MELENLRISANGKGVTKELATASMYAEMVERLSANFEIHFGPHRKIFGSQYGLYENVELYKYVPGYTWGHQDSLSNPLKAESLLRNHKFTKGQFEHLKMSSKLLRHWIPGVSLLTGDEVQVPILFVKWISSTNGIASGNTMEEAILHAICEIFERDALIRYLKFADHRDEVNISEDSIENGRIQSILSFMHENNQKTVIKYIGRGLYPAYALITYNDLLQNYELGFNQIKAGCAFNDTEALTRCFTERMQGTSFEAEAKLGNMPGDGPEKYIPVFFQGLCPMNLWPRRGGRRENFRHMELPDTGTEFDTCVDIAKELDTDLIFVDHTHPVLDFPTTRIIMPGVSDFINWWDPQKVTIDLIGNIVKEEDVYEKELFKFLKTFERHSCNGSQACNLRRRDM